MDKVEYNKRCSKFLGDKGMDKMCEDNGHHYPSLDEMKFHSDWNWIMVVVRTIVKKTRFKTIDECSEEEWYATIGVTRLPITSKKEAAVQAIDNFLIWYNEQDN